MITLRDKDTIESGSVMAEGHVEAVDLAAALADEGYAVAVPRVSHLWVTQDRATGLYTDATRNTPGAIAVTVGRLVRK